MSSNKHFINFDASTVPLQDSNLIEASAGTGKTYSIAILVLRLVLEEKLSIKEILMVTFTKAAVAELEERIRLFIRCAYKASLNEGISDTTINAIVRETIKKDGSEKVQSLLKEAVLFLDETSVLTIHSFCQQTLSEFAFETGQVFGAETLQDSSAVILEEVQKFWRKHITTLPVEFLEYLLPEALSQERIYSVVKEHLGGKKFIEYDAKTDYVICCHENERLLKKVEELKQNEEELWENLLQHVNDNKEELKRNSLGNRYAVNAELHLIDDPEEFIEVILEKRDKNFIIQLFPDILKMIEEHEGIVEDRKKSVQNIINQILCLAIRHVTNGIQQHKLRNNLLSFDDMIINLHRCMVQSENEKLITGLRKKYKAVFVDEFQDTDRMQYDIFQKVFGIQRKQERNTILFYIGDPKQSIYAWRKADIFTYFEARSNVQNLYGMNLNYRSVENFIKAMNVFFLPKEDFDTFHFSSSANTIQYIHVDAPQKSSKSQLQRNGIEDVPISICRLGSKSKILEALTAQVIALLNENVYSIQGTDKPRKITPADIGILVRTNGEGRDVKAALAKYGIPAVTIGDDKVLQSEEAAYLLYLLQAMENPSKESINRALLSPFTGFTTREILALNDEKAIELFKKYKNSWEKDGVYTALMDFVADYQVRRILLYGHTENGERIITNLFQLIELVHKVQNHKMLSPLELLGWLKRGIDGMEIEGDEYEQRVESDEESIKIVTIHKSKGLEYDIVLAPFLDFLPDKKNITMCSFRNPKTGEYVAAEKKSLTDEQQKWLLEQNEQENRRLLYVAITRAVYKCFIYKNTNNKGQYNYMLSSLTPFVDACSGLNPLLIEEMLPLTIPEGYFYAKGQQWQQVNGIGAVDFHLSEPNWGRMSYSSLAAKLETTPKSIRHEHTDPYDQFVFGQLLRGVHTGNMLHYIFENINFADSSKWEQVILDAIRRFVPRQESLYLPMLQEMLQHVLHAFIKIDGQEFQFAKVAYRERIHEFEFDFTVLQFDPISLNKLSHGGVQVHAKHLSELEGIMNGKMDLFFRYDNKYYILDWKSNFLGGSLDDYRKEKLMDVMNENNYHLQYLIYTLAAIKYLKSRLGNFDYDKDFGGIIYLFVRGVRKNSDHGIFTFRPTADLLERLNNVLTKNHELPVVGIPINEKVVLRMKKKHFSGSLIADLMRVLCFHEVLARPNKNDLYYSDEKVDEGQMYYFTSNYHTTLLNSIKEAMNQGALQKILKEERSIALLKAIESAEDSDDNGVNLTPHFIAS